MSSGFGALKSLIENNLPFAELIEHGLDEKFFEGAEKDAYSFIKNFKYAYNKYPEQKTIEAEISQSINFKELPNEPVSHWAKELKSRRRFNICSKTATDLVSHLQNNNTNEAVDVVKKCIEQLNHTQEGFALKDLEVVQKEVIEWHNKVQISPGMSGIPFGFPSLDNLTYGQQPGDFNVIVGVTGACKSYICLQSALSAYQMGYNVMIISPEMPETQIGRRLLSIQTKLKDKDFRKGRLSYYAIQQAIKKVEEPVIVNDERQDNWFKILPSGLYSDVNSLTAIAQEYKPDLLCVDGFYLIRNKHSRSSSAWAEAESVIMSLKNFAMYSQIPILATTQYNRAKPGQLEGARSSQSVEQISSNFLSLDFENKEDRDTMKPIQYRLLSTKKSRDGDLIVLKLKLNFNKMEIAEYSVISGKEGLQEDGPDFEDTEFLTEL